MTYHPSGCHYIAGTWVKGKGSLLYSTNPYDNSDIWHGHHATEQEINQTLTAANSALDHWRRLTLSARCHYLHTFAQIVTTKRQELTHLIALETGKPLWEAATEVSAVIGKIDLSITAYQTRTADEDINAPDARARIRFKPHGVVVVLGAFNFPAHLSNGHIVPALLAGNTVIYKPSELTPLVAEFIMQCWHDSGIPTGVINCIQGDATTGKALLAQDIQGVFFTGSYQTGKRIHQLFSDRPEVILALEMGGNNPLIIDDITDSQAAVYQTLLSTFITAGQRCTCARRVFIKDNVAGDNFLAQLLQASQNIRVGSYTLSPEPFMGPVISYQHALAHLQAQQRLIDSGGQSLLPMRLLREQSGLLSPGIIDVTHISNIVDEEIFAPFIQVYRYHDFDQALAGANQTRYGLVAGLLGDSFAHYEQFYDTIRAGLINWNKPTTGAIGRLPFGGVGCSGNHRPSAYFAADYCAYPIASLEQERLAMPTSLVPGVYFG